MASGTGTHPKLTSRTPYENLTVGISFIRHGESMGNKLGVVQGQKEYPLSTLGISQSQQLGQNSVMNLRVSHSFSSDLSRCLKTAEIVSGFMLHPAEIIVDKRLRERSFGTLEGLSLDQLRQELRNSGVQLNQMKPPGGESVPEVRDRVVSFFQDLFLMLRSFNREQQKLPPRDPSSLGTSAWLPDFQNPYGVREHPSQSPDEPLGASVLIFGHGGWIREALIYLEQLFPFCTEVQRKKLVQPPQNCSVTTLIMKLQWQDQNMSILRTECLWLNQVFHVSDNQQTVRNMRLLARSKSRKDMIARSISLPTGRTVSRSLDRSAKFVG